MSCNGILTPSTEDVYPDLEDIREFIHNLHVAHALATTLHEYVSRPRPLATDHFAIRPR